MNAIAERTAAAATTEGSPWVWASWSWTLESSQQGKPAEQQDRSAARPSACVIVRHFVDAAELRIICVTLKP